MIPNCGRVKFEGPSVIFKKMRDLAERERILLLDLFEIHAQRGVLSVALERSRCSHCPDHVPVCETESTPNLSTFVGIERPLHNSLRLAKTVSTADHPSRYLTPSLIEPRTASPPSSPSSSSCSSSIPPSPTLSTCTASSSTSNLSSRSSVTTSGYHPPEQESVCMPVVGPNFEESANWGCAQDNGRVRDDEEECYDLSFESPERRSPTPTQSAVSSMFLRSRSHGPSPSTIEESVEDGLGGSTGGDEGYYQSDIQEDEEEMFPVGVPAEHEDENGTETGLLETNEEHAYRHYASESPTVINAFTDVGLHTLSATLEMDSDPSMWDLDPDAASWGDPDEIDADEEVASIMARAVDVNFDIGPARDQDMDAVSNDLSALPKSSDYNADWDGAGVTTSLATRDGGESDAYLEGISNRDYDYDRAYHGLDNESFFPTPGFGHNFPRVHA